MNLIASNHAEELKSSIGNDDVSSGVASDVISLFIETFFSGHKCYNKVSSSLLFIFSIEAHIANNSLEKKVQIQGKQ
jgi:hypothetical protein